MHFLKLITQPRHDGSSRLGGFAAVLGISLAGASVLAPHPAFSETKGVIELFTSQGCSSCPPADELLGEYARNNPDLLVLSMPVTYWDYLGWKDTFAQQAFTDRQYGYAARRGDRSVYTPQAVINGESHTVGSDAKKINGLLKEGSLPVSVTMTADGSDFVIDIGEDKSKGEAIVWLTLFQKTGSVTIGRGENRDRKVTYTNIVKEMRPIAKWSGAPMSVRLPKNQLLGDDHDGVAVILQTKANELPGKILGASSWILKNS